MPGTSRKEWIIIGRNPRVEFAGACYHIIQRGNNQEDIFQRDRDKNVLVGLLQVVLTRHECMLLGYVILSNHYHLLLQTQNQPLSKVMHQFNSRFAQYYNREYDRYGHVFQGRYKAYPILDERYLFAVLRYIHQNPVRAQIVERVSDYRWSSDACYREGKPNLVDTDFILTMLSNDRQQAVSEYLRLMSEPVSKDEKREFLQELTYRRFPAISLVRTQEQESAASLLQENRHPHNQKESGYSDIKDLDALLRQCCSTDEDFQLIKAGARRVKSLQNTKMAFIRQARDAGYTMQEIGDSISISVSGVWSLLKNN